MAITHALEFKRESGGKVTVLHYADGMYYLHVTLAKDEGECAPLIECWLPREAVENLRISLRAMLDNPDDFKVDSDSNG